MKKTFAILIILFIQLHVFCQQNTEFEKFLERLNHKQLFELKYMSIQNDSWQSKYMEAVKLSTFGKPSESNTLINAILLSSPREMHDSLKLTLLEYKIINCALLCDYKEALGAEEMVLKDFSAYLKGDDLEDHQNSLIIWRACKDVSAQETALNKESVIEYKRDLAGLIDFGVTINKKSERFKFDTGANISTIRKSVAIRDNLRMLEGKIRVGTATGDKVDAELAMADELLIGNVVFKNVLFLVLPDEALSFAGGIYTIDGIVGIPVIREMGEINIKEKNLEIPLTSSSIGLGNLAFSEFSPVVNLVHNSDSLAFLFDSGARTTMLYMPYFEKYKNDIAGKYELTETDFEGAGTKKTVKAYKLTEVTFSLGSKRKKLENISLLTEITADKSEYFFGNLGQDFFTSFKTLKLDFRNMSIEAE